MKQKNILVLTFVAFFSMLLYSPVIGEETWNASYSDHIIIHFAQHNPINITFTDGKNGFIETDLATIEGTYSATSLVASEKFEFSQVSLVDSIRSNAQLDKDGLLQINIIGKETTAIVTAAGSGDLRMEVSNGDPPFDTKQVKAFIHVSAEEGLLNVNAEEPQFGLPSDEEQISRVLGVSNDGARDLISKHGTSKIFNAINEATNFGNRYGDNLMKGSLAKRKVAGGGGALISSEGGAIDISTLDPSTVFDIFLNEPFYKGTLMNSELEMQLIHGPSERQIKGVEGTITIAGPVNGDNPSPKNVILLDTVTFNEEKGFYYYKIKKEDFLVDPSNITPGGYNLFVDFGQMQHIKLAVTIDEDLKVFTGRY